MDKSTLLNFVKTEKPDAHSYHICIAWYNGSCHDG